LSESKSVNEQIVDLKTIVYKTLVDPAVVKVAGEKLKDKLFVRFRFLKPKPNEIEFVSIDKYYKPYIIISGEYTIDYYRKCVYSINVDEKAQEVILLKHKFKPEKPKGTSTKGYKVIKLEGEERLLYDDKASIIINKLGREVPLKQLPAAPSEENPKQILTELGEKVEKLEIAMDGDVEIIRSKLLKRPENIDRVVHELFEVDERALIYTPIYRVLFRNVRTGDVKAIEFDGVTSKRLQ